jgi:hypothetical protein
MIASRLQDRCYIGTDYKSAPAKPAEPAETGCRTSQRQQGSAPGEMLQIVKRKPKLEKVVGLEN